MDETLRAVLDELHRHGAEHDAARADRGQGSAVRSDPQHFVEDIGHLVGIGAIELNPFAGDMRRRRIDEFF